MVNVRWLARSAPFALVALLMLLVPIAGYAQTIALVPDEPSDGILDVPHRYHAFWLPEGVWATVTLISYDFDPYLVILGPDRWIIGQNDDWDWGPDAAYSFATEEAGWYTAVVTSLAGVGRGEYQLWLDVERASPAGGERPDPGTSVIEGTSSELIPGVPIHTTLTDNHLGDAAEGGLSFTFAGETGDFVSIVMTSDVFDTTLRLLDPSGIEIAYNDDADRSFGSQIVTQLPSTGVYTVVASSWYWGSGDFTLLLEHLPELHVSHGRMTESDARPDGDIHHEYEWTARAGATAEVWLAAEFDAYLEVYDEWGTLIAWDDDSGGILDARLKLDAIDEGVYRIRATSPSGGGTGTYTLYFWSRTPDGGPGSEAPLVALGDYDATISGQGPSDREPVTLVVGEMTAGQVNGNGDVRNFVVDLPNAGGTYDVWLFAQTDFDLYGNLDKAIEGWIDAVYASEHIEGYEHIRVASVQGGEQLFLQVAPYGDPVETGRAFWLLVQEAEAGADAWPRWEAVPDEPARYPLAGRLVPGVVYRGEFDVDRFDTQFWTLEVPEGVERVHVGLFNADGDMDLSMTPGWLASSYGILHDAFSISVRENERLSIGGPDDFITEVTPGLYTIAVWPGVDGPNTYEILVSFDEPLPPSSRYEPLDPRLYATMSPIRRAQFATVQVQNLAAAGSGTIVTPDGLILTNYHVVADCKVSTTTAMGCVAYQTLEEINATEQIVSLTDEDKGYARQHFVAEVVRALPEFDLALIEITADLDGNPVQDLALPTVPLEVRDSGAVVGDEVLVLGYPDIARLTTRTPLTLTRGILSGFTTQRDQRVFLQFDAGIADGNSGGALVRFADGVLIGVPSDRVYSETSVVSQSFARPLSLIPQEWLDLIVSRGGRMVQ